MLRITPICDVPLSVTLLVEGRIADEWVAVLDNEVAVCLQSRASVELNLAGVSYLDAAGLKLLRAFPRDRVHLAQCTAFIRALLAKSDLA